MTQDHPSAGQPLLWQNFIDAYPELVIYGSNCPKVRVFASVLHIFRLLAKLRRKRWSSSMHWNSSAELTGVLAEMAMNCFLGVNASLAMVQFKEGIHGDQGLDHPALSLDVKATQGQARRFKFSKTNAFRDAAKRIAFCYVEYVGDEAWVHLLGWAWKADIRRYMRFDGRSDVVRFDSLQRDGLIRPMSTLKQQEGQQMT